MKFFKKVVSSALIMSMIVTASGCSAGSSDTTNPSGSAAASQDPAASPSDAAAAKDSSTSADGVMSTDPNKKNIVVWCWDPNYNVPIMDKAKAIYEKDHPDANIVVVNMAKAAIEQKLNTILASNVSTGNPDIVLIEDYQSQKYLQSFPGSFVSLDDIVSNDDFGGYKMKLTSFNNTIYGLPFDSGVTGIMYREDLLTQAGFTDADLQNITWDRYLEIGKQVKEKTGKYMLSLDPTDLGITMTMIQSAGSWYTDEQGNATIAGNPALKKSLELFKGMLDSEIAVKRTGWEQFLGALNNGEVASVVSGLWLIPSIRQEASQSGQWRIAPTPRLFDDSVNASNLGGTSWYVLNTSQNKDVAKDFLKTVYAGDVSFYGSILKDQNAIGIYKPSHSAPEYQEPDPYFGGQKIFQLAAQWTGEIPSVAYGMYSYEARDAITAQLDDILSNKKTIDQALIDAQNQFENQIKE